MQKKFLIVTVLVIFPLWPAGLGQDKGIQTVRPSSSAFPIGEKLTYDVSWSNFIVAGELTLTAERTVFQGKDAYRALAEARSVGLVSRLVSKVRDVYESFLDVGTLQPFRVEKRTQHGKRQRQSYWTIDSVRHVATLENGKALEVPDNTYDLASIVYALRRVDLNQGKQAGFTVLEDGKLYTLRIEAERNEKVYTRAGTFETSRLVIKIGESGQAGDTHRLRLHVTRDARRLPVLLTAEPSWGEVRMELTAVATPETNSPPRTTSDR